MAGRSDRPTHLAPTTAAPGRAGLRHRLRRSTEVWLLLAIGAALAAWLAAVVLALGGLAADNGWWDTGTIAPRCGAAAATWFGLLLLARRIGLPVSVVAGYTGVALALAVLFATGWALSAACVAAASTYGLLAVVTTRAARGLWCVREAVLAVFVSVVGAVVVSGYDVTLRAVRFRALVLVLALLAAVGLASQLSRADGATGRLGLATAVVCTAAAVVAIGVFEGVLDVGQGVAADPSHTGWSAVLHLGPMTLRPLEAFVGVPALVWGAAQRWVTSRGWWLAAFGVLATAGIATSLLSRGTDPGASLATVGWGLGVGVLIGSIVVGVQHAVVRRRPESGLVAGRRRRRRPPPVERSRLSPLL